MSIKLMQLVWDADVPQSRKLVLLSLADQANDAGECYPRISTIERRCSMGRRTVFQALADLEAGGFLTRHEHSSQRVLFKLDATRLRQLSFDQCGSSTGAKSALVQMQHQCASGTGADDAETGAESAPDRCQIGTPIKQPPLNPKEPSGAQDGAHGRADEPLTAGRAAIELRKRGFRINAMNPSLVAAVADGVSLAQLLAMADAYPDKSAGYVIAAAADQHRQGPAPARPTGAPREANRRAPAESLSDRAARINREHDERERANAHRTAGGMAAQAVGADDPHVRPRLA